MRLLHQRHDHGILPPSWPRTGNRPRRRSSRRSPTTSAAAARMPASSGPSSAQPAPPEGGNHEHAFQAIASRRSQGRRRSRRQLFVRLRTFGEAFAQAAAAAKPLALTEVDSFLAIDAKGMCTVYSGKVDLGTGTDTALRQMAAEELDLPLTPDQPSCRGDTALTPDQGTTWGSLTIQVGGIQIRQASAAARAALLEEAAKRLNVKKEDLDGSRRRHQRRRQARYLWRADRRQELLDQARSEAAGADEGSQELQDRRQIGARASTSPAR